MTAQFSVLIIIKKGPIIFAVAWPSPFDGEKSGPSGKPDRWLPSRQVFSLSLSKVKSLSVIYRADSCLVLGISARIIRERDIPITSISVCMWLTLTVLERWLIFSRGFFIMHLYAVLPLCVLVG